MRRLEKYLEQYALSDMVLCQGFTYRRDSTFSWSLPAWSGGFMPPSLSGFKAADAL